MSFSRTVTKFSVKKMLFEKWQLAMWILIPLLIGGMFSLITDSEGQPKPVGTLLVTDHDETMLSEFIIGGFNQGPMAEMFIQKSVSTEEGQRLMSEGEASAWIEIEKGFTENFLNNQQTTLRLVKNPSQNILPDIAETALKLITESGHYIQQLFKQELLTVKQIMNNEKISDVQMAELSVKIKNTVENLEDQLFPPQLKAEKKTTENKPKDKPQVTFLMLMFPGIIFMSLMFASQGLALDFWKDKSTGVIRRMLASPQELGAYHLGKTYYSCIAFLIIATILGLLGLILLKSDLLNIFVILIWVGLSGLVLWSMMLFLCLLMPSEKSASIVTSAMVFPLLMLGGSFFPFEAMPKWMVSIGQWLPNGYLIQSFKRWFVEGEAIQVLVVPAMVAIAVIITFYIINHKLLKPFARSQA